MKIIRFLAKSLLLLCVFCQNAPADDQPAAAAAPVPTTTTVSTATVVATAPADQAQPVVAPVVTTTSVDAVKSRSGIASAPSGVKVVTIAPMAQGINNNVSHHHGSETKKTSVEVTVKDVCAAAPSSKDQKTSRLKRKGPNFVNVRLNRAEGNISKSVMKDKKRNISELEEIKIENNRLEREIQQLLAGEFGFESAIEDHEIFKFVFPGYARPIDKEGYAFGIASFSNADWGYDDKRKVISLGSLIFSNTSDPLTPDTPTPTSRVVQFQDISLISRLARLSSTQNGITWGSSQPLASGAAPGTQAKYLIGDTSLSATALTGLESAIFAATTIAANAQVTNAIANAATIEIWNHYLNRIADFQLNFTNNSKRFALDLFFAKNFCSNNYNVVFSIPVVFRSNKAVMDAEFSPSKIAELNGANGAVLELNPPITSTSTANVTSLVTPQVVSNIFAQYPGGMKDVFKAFLKFQNIDSSNRCSQIGIGDIALVVNRKMNVRELDLRGVIGFGITAPTSVKVDNRQLWPAVLGNGGFWELTSHIAAYTSLSNFANPHIFCQIKFPLPASVEMRASEVVKRQGTPLYASENERASDYAFGQEFVFSDQFDWIQSECKVPLLARDPLRSIDVNKGVTYTLEAGTLLKDIISKDFSIDLLYRLIYKTSDSSGFSSKDSNLDVAALFANTTQQSHRVAFTLCYRYKKDFQFEFSYGQVVLGQNVPRNIDASIAAHLSF